MKVAHLFSGGKDSTFALYLLMLRGWEPLLIGVRPSSYDSYMFHKPGTEILKRMAKCLGMKLFVCNVSGEKEREVMELLTFLKGLKEKEGFDALSSGALASDYQRQRVNFIGENLKIPTYAPLWHKDGEMLMREMVYAGFKILITSVACDGLGEEWLGEIIDEESIDEIIELSRKYGFHPAFEGGEAETLVIDGPIFREKPKLRWKKVWLGDRGHLVFKI